MFVVAFMLHELTISNGNLLLDPSDEMAWLFNHSEPSIWEIITYISYMNSTVEETFNDGFILDDQSAEAIGLVVESHLTLIEAITFLVYNTFDLVGFRPSGHHV